ncbi:dynamin family protein [Comamonas sp. MYb21]|uniref:dynamin family protein n=1 Tax=Comamonas sp. MYb21 TaxID=1848648 RepID=UPI0030AE6407
MNAMAGEQQFLAHAGGSAAGPTTANHQAGLAQLHSQLQQLQAWQTQLQQGLGSALAPTPGLQPSHPLAQQAQALQQQCQDLQARWAQQWSALQPARSLAQDFEQRVILLVFGKFNAGKSSLCNFLAERFAAQGQPLRFFHLADGAVVESDEPLREGATETTARLQGLCLGTGLVLLDTPGLHSVTPENAALTQRFTESADGLLWLSSSTSPGQVQELDELARELRRNKPLLPVITRSDLIEEDEVDGEIQKCLRNKTPGNRALQEADVQARAQGKLRQLGIDVSVLKRPVSISVHAARSQPGPDALANAGLLRLYTAIAEVLAPAQVYKQRKPAEVLLHHLEENLQGAIDAELRPQLQRLQQVLAQEQERLQHSKTAMLRAAWRQTIPALPGLLDLYADRLPLLFAEVAALVRGEIREQLRSHLAGYALPALPAEPATLGWPPATVGPDALYATLQNAVREQLEMALAAAVDTCSHALEPMVLPVAQMQAHLRQCSQDLHGVGTTLRA